MTDNDLLKNGANSPTFSDYGEDFQDRVIQALLIDFAWAEQMYDIIKVEYFELEHFQYLVKRYYDYYLKHRTFPTIPILANILKQSLQKGIGADNIILSKIVILLKKVKENPDLRDLPYVKEQALDFCKKQAMKEALLRSTELILENDDYDEVLEIMKKALIAGEESSVGHDFEEDREARFTDTARSPIPTGIPELDQQGVLDGGLGRGELGIFVAAPSVGKSHWLVQIGAAALRAGFNVLHYTLEMGESEVGRRYDGWFTGVNNREITRNRNEVNSWYENNGDTLGRLIIKEYPSSTVTTNTFRAHIQKLMTKKNFYPDLVIVDYADEMCSLKKFESASRHEFKAIYRDLRNIGREMSPKFAVWSASQSNKEGSSAEIVTGENMSESFRKLDVPDFVFTGACRPDQKASGAIRGFSAKNRNGRDGDILPMRVNKKTSRFEVISEEEFSTLVQTDKQKEDDLKSRIGKRLKDF